LNNTFVGCHAYADGAAFQAFGGNVLSFERNLVTYSTGAAGVQNYGAAPDPNFCNLYWSNSEGDFGTWIPSPTDLFADPIFCDLALKDFTVREDSPCVVGGCGQIGALGVGCKNISVEPQSWGRIKELYRLGR
jgi:hypothetical protein